MQNCPSCLSQSKSPPYAQKCRPVTASFGVSEITEGIALKQVIEQADQALYQAKQAGRNRVIGFRAEEAGA